MALFYFRRASKFRNKDQLCWNAQWRPQGKWLVGLFILLVSPQDCFCIFWNYLYSQLHYQQKLLAGIKKLFAATSVVLPHNLWASTWNYCLALLCLWPVVQILGCGPIVRSCRVPLRSHFSERIARTPIPCYHELFAGSEQGDETIKKLPSALPDHSLTRNYLELRVELLWLHETKDRYGM